MHRLGVLLVSLLLAACAGTPVQCGTCAGAGYVVEGDSAVAGRRWVTECVEGLPCVTHEERGPTAVPGQRSIDLPSSTRWEDLDGVTLTVRIRGREADWSGHGTLHYEAGGKRACDCPSLSARVPLVAVNRGG